MAKAQRIAMALGAVSTGIGTWYAATPRHFLSVIGAPATERRIAVTRLVAVQELSVGLGLLADGRATRWVAMRVVGDVLHGAMLALAVRAPDTDRGRMRLALAALIGITATDLAALLAARQIERTGADVESGNDGTTPEALAVERAPVHRSVTIRREPAEVYAFWRELENLPTFMKHLESVELIDERRSRWRAKAPGGASIEWEAEITDERPGERIAWTSREGAQVWNSGEVTFERAAGDRGTQVRVRLDYEPPGGRLGAGVARLLGEAPSNQIAGDLRRLKQVLETGEVAISDAVAEGRSRMQRPAQPIEIA
ncbi:MAG TPA: SRPBCC family protein [Candidatus Limnocylindrales bacterium]|nr:SRPBCC family protein [Candidatus Limnocylindrales bacterium]